MDAFSSRPWYLDHIAPVWRALGPDAGTLYVTAHAASRAELLGLDYEIWDNQPGPVTLVAAYGDLRDAHKIGRQTAYMEHGNGQTFNVSHPSYAGGSHPARDACLVYLAPGPRTAEKLRATHPDTPVFEVGCPKLDTYVNRTPRPAGKPPVVVTSFHWDAQVCPETGSSFRYYANAVASLARGSEFRVMGHGHPLAMRELRRWYDRQRIPIIETFEEVLDVADVYITDGSSTLFEAAAAHIPVVVLNSPKYRRDVEHGIRFWEASTVGPNVNAPLDLAPAVRRALRLLPEDVAERERCLDIVYSHRDGSSAERAATAIRSIL
jgi:hypothetical protein